ncbi:glycosyltransferase [Saccharibacillus sp. CPCC 101409]|uniref:MGDG synthase family glycosyltransferase n=1 Tax=Saccharibacillus sp. CPCC 101409 TaxID=3058041 RepID=UPI002670FB8F|nr:glycosyltransferase [Saccharibacillus sp. CPCC 101409]MDO3411463.1 glycosyltransferase [Saccharibacillus sp. CPCC 101409]
MQPQEPNVLILYASYGDGHYQATKALERSLNLRGISRVKMLDLMAESHPKLNDLTRFVYMQSYRTIPGLYGLVYNMTKDMKADKPFANILHAFGTRRLEEYLKHEQPDVVIHTFPQMVMPKLRRKIGLDIPIVNVLTDFDLHGRWLHPDVDRFYVATEEMRREAATIGIDPDRIAVSGIPIKEGFGPADGEHAVTALVPLGGAQRQSGAALTAAAAAGVQAPPAGLPAASSAAGASPAASSAAAEPQAFAAADACAAEAAAADSPQLAGAASPAAAPLAAARALRAGEPPVPGVALDPARRTVLLMAGAYGVMLGLRRVCDLLLAQDDIQIVVVCGRNEEMRAGLRQQYANTAHIHILGFTDRVASLMRMSDCVVTKPGGITLAESLACRLPIFLFRPVPGQERNNAVYLAQRGVAFISRSADELALQIADLFGDPAKLRRARDRAAELGHPNASDEIADDLIARYLSPAAAQELPV